MKKSLVFFAVTGALLTAGCDKASDSGQGPATAASLKEAVAIVNGKPISSASVEILTAELGQRRGGNDVPEDKIVEELIKRELLRQEAESAGLVRDPKFAARIENAQRMLLSQAAAEHFISTVQVSDEDLKKEYDARIGPLKMTEFKARHILVDSEQLAKDIIAKLQKGEKFDVLAKKTSKDPGSKGKGGDLGWFSPQQMVPAFSEAVAALKNGEITKTPVQSQFGWHVILREDSREQAPPPFDQVKDQLRSLVQTQKLQQHLAELQSKAKIENRFTARPKPPAAPAASLPPDSSLEAGKPLAPGAGQPPGVPPAASGPATKPPAAAPKTP